MEENFTQTHEVSEQKEPFFEKEVYYFAKKHWFFWFWPCAWSFVTCLTIIIPIFILGYTFLRWVLDKVEIKDNCLYSRLGVIFIDKKVIPLEQISFISVKTNVFGELLNVGDVEIQSSAFAKAISYSYIEDPNALIKFVNEHKPAIV